MLYKKPGGFYEPFSKGTSAINPDTGLCWELPEEFGHGTFKRFGLRQGFELFLTDFELYKPMVGRRESDRSIFGLNFMLSGEMSSDSSKCRRSNVAANGQYEFYHLLPDQNLFCETKANDRLIVISILIDPDLLSIYLKGLKQELPISLRHLLASDEPTHYFQNQPITPAISSVLQQIMLCEHSGLIRSIFMESKVFELISLFLSNYCAQDEDKRSVFPEDSRKVKTVARLIDHRLDNPPTLMELSRTVGVSHPKLNACFRKVYGKTVFEYIRQNRLARARFLLEEGNMNVTEVAYTVGYSSLSHFTKAFKAQFGVLPGSYSHNRPDR